MFDSITGLFEILAAWGLIAGLALAGFTTWLVSIYFGNGFNGMLFIVLAIPFAYAGLVLQAKVEGNKPDEK